MACLTKVQIIDSKDIKMEKVFVPEWADGDLEAYVMVKALSAKEQDEFDKTIIKETKGGTGKPKVDLTNYRAKRAAFCLCDDDGNLLFTPEEIPALAEKSSIALTRVLTVDKRLNGDLEALEKNSETTQNEDSPSD